MNTNLHQLLAIVQTVIAQEITRLEVFAFTFVEQKAIPRQIALNKNQND